MALPPLAEGVLPTFRSEGRVGRSHQRRLRYNALNLESLSPLTSRPLRAGRDFSPIRLRLWGNRCSFVAGTPPTFRAVGEKRGGLPIGHRAPYVQGVICRGCYRFSPLPLCRECFSDLRPAPDRVLPGGVRAVAAFDHTGVAARLVHGFKYRGDGLLVALAVGVLAGRIEPGLKFVPVPRVWTRFVRYGVDPATVLARALAGATGGSVSAPLRRPIHNPRRAGSRHRAPAPALSLRQVLQNDVVVVDDVLTTGGTVSEAIKALRPASIPLVVTATSARQVSSLLVPVVSSHAVSEVTRGRSE